MEKNSRYRKPVLSRTILAHYLVHLFVTERKVQTIYVHDKHEIKDDGEKIAVPSLNTHGEIQNREELAEAVSRKVDLDGLAGEVGKDIGDAVFTDGEVEEVNLYHWVLEQYGHEEN